MAEDPAPADHRTEDVSYVQRALPTRRRSPSSPVGPPRWDVQWRNRTVGDVLVFGVTPPFVVVQDYASRRAPFTDVEAAAEARRRVGLRRGGRSCSAPRTSPWAAHSGSRRAAHHQGRHREEGHGAGTVVGRVRHAPAHHLRGPVRTSSDHRDLGQNAGGGACADGMLRAEEAMRIAHGSGRGGGRLYRRYRRGADRVLGQAHPRHLHGRAGRGGDRIVVVAS